ncbi:uncharacterized protein FOMMEDRAFT_31485 [Fomitiporia mediterranea MF3/22]|uniref:uncharacterized protein n=1 Tax=Fomitiporia mediterranea (strain MF3/22) TaxID=694068 RepID=UPI0004409854|nr:uncharacterized protein FOMMEDRAFT_31485 [Fomitiporia mediterranea MF3/22]EJC98902.1 hypothetical protein FOMMEDRAFT_31485 [Fomitiporia mediterranea MF3/22]
MNARVVDSARLFEPQTGLLIPFNSHSDALLAQLPLQHGMSKQHFNLLLDILRDPSFDMDQLNLKSATDIDIRISEHRRQLAEERSQRAHSSSVFSPASGSCKYFKATSENTGPVGMPSIVFELLIDELVSQMEHFDYETDATPGSSEGSRYYNSQTHARTSTIQTCLKRMSFVHRSWTELAQRALRRRAILTSRRFLREFARSPACGAGVREFAYKIPKSETCTFFHEASVAREHWSTLASVISRLSTLRFLCLSIESAHLADLSGLDLVLNSIAGLTSLEGLWLVSSRDHCPYLPQLCQTISKLPNLRFLSIFNWTCPRRPTVSDTLEMRERVLELTPPASLTALQIRDDYLTTPPAYLSWLFRPRNSYSLTTLDLHITFSRPLPTSLLDPTGSNSMYTNPHVDFSHLLASLSPLLPHIHSLAIKLFYLDTSSAVGATMHDTDLQDLLARCASLRRVRLHRLRSGPFIDGIRMPGIALSTPLILPVTLEELHMHYTYSAINWRTQDQRLCGTLGAAPMPSLRRVLVSTGETDLTLTGMRTGAGMGYGPEEGRSDLVDPYVDLPRTRELCEKLGVELVRHNREHLNQYVIDALS